MNSSTSTSPEPVVEMKKVSIGSMRGGTGAVLEQIDWTVQPGEFWVVAGHHGSGKSDLLWTLAGLMPPDTGDYRLMDEEMPVFEDVRRDVQLNVGLVLGGGRLLNHLSLGENIALPVRYHQDLDEVSALGRVAQVLEVTGLTQRVAQMPGALGRHWRQRAGLARALATDPDLLLLDDPLSGLDSQQAVWWVNFLNELHLGKLNIRSDPMTIVLVTDTLDPWRKLATHCALLEQGRMVLMGRPGSPEMDAHPKMREYGALRRWGFDAAEGI